MSGKSWLASLIQSIKHACLYWLVMCTQRQTCKNQWTKENGHSFVAGLHPLLKCSCSLWQAPSFLCCSTNNSAWHRLPAYSECILLRVTCLPCCPKWFLSFKTIRADSVTSPVISFLESLCNIENVYQNSTWVLAFVHISEKPQKANRSNFQCLLSCKLQ